MRNAHCEDRPMILDTPAKRLKWAREHHGKYAGPTEAARAFGVTHARILLRHVLPNVLPPVMVVATVQIAQAIALEATLSFLGLGLPITEPSLNAIDAGPSQGSMSAAW